MMNTELLKEMHRRMALDYFGMSSVLPQSRRARRDYSRAHFAGAGFGTSGTTSDAKSRWLSRLVFGQFGLGNLLEDRSLGGYLVDDFGTWNGTVSAKVGTYAGEAGGYKSFEETSGTIKQLNTLVLNSPLSSQFVGGIELSVAAATSNTVALEAGGGNGGSWGITGNNAPQLAFEARLAINKTAVTGFDVFVGLLEKGGAASQFIINSSDALTQKSFIGFWSLTAAPTVINAGYGKNANAAVIPTVGAAAAWAAPVSSIPQYTKLGFVYDQRQPAPLLKFYQDGVLISTVSDCSGSTFPTGVALVPTVVIQTDASAGVAVKLDLDWWATALLF